MAASLPSQLTAQFTAQLAARDEYIAGFAAFVAASPTSYHAAHAAAELLLAAGFTELDEAEAWPVLEAGTGAFTRRDGAIIAWRAGASVTASSPVRVLGCHTDSPGLVLKPKPDFSAQGWAQVGVEVYGGPLLTTWFDRDLAIAGRLVTADGREHLVRTEAVARVPMLAIHLDRDSGNGMTLDRQRHMQPVIGVGSVSVGQLLADAAGVEASEIAGADVRLVDTQTPALLGAHGELLASPRLDNLSSVYAGLVALISAASAGAFAASGAAAGDAVADDAIAMLAAFDHEELGSETRSGACGPLLEDVLVRLRAGLGASSEEAARAMASSWCLSADAGHSVHPNYAEKHDPNVHPLAGDGPMLKVNANQRYATDAHGEALWQRLCEHAGVPSQVFVSNNSVPCGSTIGPLTATRLGMRTLDAGVPLLSMHSVRELVHVDDLHGLARVANSFFTGV